MTAARRFTVAAMLILAAFAFLAAPAMAGCGDDDPTCELLPPQSRQVAISSSPGEQAPGEAGPSAVLNPLLVAMPPPNLMEAIVVRNPGAYDVPSFDTLELPFRRQSPEDVSCGVQALGMALDPLEGAAPSSAALLDFLRNNDYLYAFGTGVEELALAAREFGYAGSVSFHHWTLAEITSELDAGRPVVVDLGANGQGKPGHFVTLTGISPDGAWVAYKDPLLGQRVVPMEEFLTLWARQGNSGVAVARTPPAPLNPDYAPWAALASAMLATLALAPSMLTDSRRRGVGGMLIAESGGGGSATFVGMHPPYAAPAGMRWVQGEAVYENQTRTEIVYHEIPKAELRQIQVGTKIETLPYTKRILVDNGRWVTDFKTERYITGYRNKKILSGYRSERYVKSYRTKLVRTRWGYTRERIPVYGYRRVPVYRTVREPIFGTRQVADGKHWESNWEYEEFTAYRTVERPVYEQRWVTVGIERVPEEKVIEEEVLRGYKWYLVHEQPIDEPDIFDEMQDLKNEILQENWMVTTAYSLSLREQASSSSRALGYIPYGTYIHWTGISNEIGETTWYKVKYWVKGELLEGWVSNNWLTPSISGTSGVMFESQIERIFSDHAVALEGTWNLRDKRAAAVAIDAVAKAMARELGSDVSQAFEVVYNQLTLVWGTESDSGHLTSECSNIDLGGCTSSGHLINFMSLWPSGPYRTEEVAFQASVNNVVHELGHAFANLWWTVDPETGAVEYSEDGPYHQLGLREHDYLLTNDGFQKGMNAAENLWRQHPENIPTPNEVFADMFLGWVYDQWLDDQNGERRQDYMGENMESWIQNITEWK